MIGRWVVSYLARKRNRLTAGMVRGRLLDIGCGDNALVKMVGKGTGVDVHAWPGVDMVIEDAAKLPFPDDSFDTITFVASLNHIPNREDALREASRVMAPNGQILLTMIGPAISRIWHHLIRKHDADQSERGMNAGEVWGLTRSQIASLAEAMDLSVTKVIPFELGLNHLYVIEH